MSLPHTSERNDNIAFIAGGPPCDDITVTLRRYVVVCRVCVYTLTSDLDGEDWLNCALAQTSEDTT